MLSLSVLTGRRSGGDWAARQPTTTALIMAFLGALALVRAALRTHARPTSTPATVLERGTLHVLEYTRPLTWNPQGKSFRAIDD